VSLSISRMFTQRAEIRDRCCCPNPDARWWRALAGVIHGQVHCSTADFTDESSAEEDARVYDVARVSVAPAGTSNKLTMFYETISKSKLPRVINGQNRHPPLLSLFYFGQTNLL